MKKSGFTLAEVLITLAIIGVVASLTLPALMQNSSEQQAKTALKKGINTLTEIAQTSNAIDGYDYGSLKVVSATGNNLETDMSLYTMMAKRGSIDMKTSGNVQLINTTGADDGNFAIFFRDGSAISFPAATTALGQGHDTIQADGLPEGFPILFDMNGRKGPNTLSNCSGSLTATVDADQGTQTLDEVCTKQNRVIKDQFGLKLRGGYATPNGPAARWAFEN